MQPASADQLFERISAAAAENDPGELHAVQGDVGAFLAHYADDPRAAQVRDYMEQIELNQLGRQAEFRARSAKNVDNATPLERALMEAMDYAKLNPEIAVERLSAIVDLYDRDDSLSPADTAALKLARQQWKVLTNQIEQRAAADLRVLLGRLDAADVLENSDPAAAAAIRQAVVKLYAGKPWAARAVARAEAALVERTAASARPNP